MDGLPYISCALQYSFADSIMARFMMLTTMSQQTSVPDAVQGTTLNPNALPLSVVDAY
jgi:hypothetical protein